MSVSALKHLSYSSVSRYLGCGEQWRRKYPEREPMPIGLSGVRGIAVHYVAEKASKDAILGKPAMSQEEAGTLGYRQVLLEVEHGLVWIKPGDIEKHGSDEAAVEHYALQARVLSECFMREVAPMVGVPQMVEQKITLHLNAKMPPIIGYIDLFSGGFLWDFKTKEKKPGDKDAESSDQLALYQLMLEASGEECAGAKQVYLVYRGVTKTRHEPTAEVFVQQVKHTKEQKTRTLLRIMAAHHGMESGAFIPCDPSHWKCSPEWCWFYNDCAFGAGPAKVSISYAAKKESKDE